MARRNQNLDDLSETWHPVTIEPWNNLVEVSTHGRVRHAPRLMAQTVRLGYKTISLRWHGKQLTVGVHRLVASAFIRKPEENEVVNHLNSDRTDNRVENLEWTTISGNTKHMWEKGRANAKRKIDLRVAVEMRKSGHTLRSIAERFGCTITAVSSYLKRAKDDGRYDLDTPV